MPTDPSPAARGPARLGRSYSFHFLWTSTFASGFADRLAMLSVQVMLGYGVIEGVMADRRLPDASIVAGINFFFFLPYVLWGPFAGWLADRLPRKWIMFVADEARGVIVLFAFTLLPAGSAGEVPGMYEPWLGFAGLELTHAWKVWGLMFCIGFFAATFTPARNSIIPNVVGYHVLQRANSVIIGMGIIGNLFGFIVGGPLSEHALRACILASALCYLLPGWMWPFLKTPVRRHARPGLGAGLGPLTPLIEVGRGGRYILQHHPLAALTVVFIMFWGGSQLVMAAGGAIAVGYHGGTGDVEDFAMIAGGFGLGMLLGAVLLGTINSRLGSEVIITVCMIGVAICLSLLVVVPIKALGVVIAIACGLFGGSLLITINSMAQQITADGFRGRVMGFKDMMGDLAGIIVSFVIWRLPDADRHVLTAAHVFSGLLIVTALWGLRRYVFRGPMHRPMLNLGWRVVRLYGQAFHRVRFDGAHHVPSTGGAVLVINHTSGVDPFLVQAALQRRVRWMMATDMMIRPMRWFWRLVEILPVDRDTGRGTRQSLRAAIAALDRGELVGIFPEGGINRAPGEGLKAFESGVGLLAHRADAPLVAVYIDGTPRGVSAYGSLWRASHSRVVFGRPVTAAELRDEARDRPGRNDAIAAALRRRIEALRDGSAERDTAPGDSHPADA